jgi:hypothetical protein
MVCDTKHTYEPKAALETLPPHRFGHLLFFCMIDSCLPLLVFMSIQRAAKGERSRPRSYYLPSRELGPNSRPARLWM